MHRLDAVNIGRHDPVERGPLGRPTVRPLRRLQRDKIDPVQFARLIGMGQVLGSARPVDQPAL